MENLLISKENLLPRFLEYARIDTASNPEKEPVSSEGQWTLLKKLKEELESLDNPLLQINLDVHGYLSARLKASPGYEKKPAIAFLSHVDVSYEAPSTGIKPVVHDNYQGQPLVLNNDITLDPIRYPVLSSCIGHDLVTSDGTTLLGADDKAGITVQMAVIEYLLKSPQLVHGPLEFYFTPDEETGRGMDQFPIQECAAAYAYTLDGDESGCIETECFHADKVVITFDGIVTHPGTARGKMINAVTLSSAFLSAMPTQESPEATDGRYGFYCALSVTAEAEKAVVNMILRDFDKSILDRRGKALRALAGAFELLYPGSKIHVEITNQYSNMHDTLQKHPEGILLLEHAVKETGLACRYKLIRGGTDGSRLTALGIPTPNIFTGGQNFHSRSEWVSINVMRYCAQTVLNLIKLWAKQ